MTHDLITKDRRAIILWLGLCIALVAMMVLIGGYTRLSGSGLSITSWKPIHGTLPPLNETQWAEEFKAYQDSPQFRIVNNTMSLAEFKVIFWPEYLHRLLGRMIGMVMLLPLIAFALRRSISQRFGWRLAAIFALGGLQGLIGWLMVKSGLASDPHVSHLRLALHLSMAFAILALLEWALLDTVAGGQWTVDIKRISLSTAHCPLYTYFLFFALLCLQIILGAFMAGLHAGLIYNTWPTMDGQWVPEGLITALPWYDNLTMVQFLHRTTAVLLPFFFLFWWRRHREYVRNSQLESICACVAALIALQFFLGVLTLVNAVPLRMALAHQMTALLLFMASTVILWRTQYEHRILCNGGDPAQPHGSQGDKHD